MRVVAGRQVAAAVGKVAKAGRLEGLALGKVDAVVVCDLLALWRRGAADGAVVAAGRVGLVSGGVRAAAGSCRRDRLVRPVLIGHGVYSLLAGVWRVSGFVAHSLSVAARVAARRRLLVGHAVHTLPLIDDAIARGAWRAHAVLAASVADRHGSAGRAAVVAVALSEPRLVRRYVIVSMGRTMEERGALTCSHAASAVPTGGSVRV